MSKRSLWYVTTLPSLVAIGIVIAEMFLLTITIGESQGK